MRQAERIHQQEQQRDAVEHELIIVAHEAQQLGQDRDEDGADDHAGGRADAAQHQHNNELRAVVGGEGRRSNVLHDPGVEHTGQAAEDRGDEEGHELELRHAQADGLDCLGVIADSLERAAVLGLRQTHGEDNQQDCNDQNKVVQLRLRLKNNTENIRLCNVLHAHGAAGQPLHAVGQRVDDLCNGHGSQGQEDAADAETRVAEHEADENGDDQSGQQTDEVRRAGRLRDQGRRIGAEGYEGDGAEVRLARQTHDHVQAENGDEVDERLAEKLDVIVCGVDHGQDDSHNQHDHGQDQGSYRNLFAFHFHYPFPIRLCGA